MNTEKAMNVLTRISKNMQEDAKFFDGKPFTGKTVATYLAYQGAAIAVLADIMKAHLEETQHD